MHVNIMFLYNQTVAMNNMHQSIKTPSLCVPEKGSRFDIDPGLKAAISLPPEARAKLKISKNHRKKDIFSVLKAQHTENGAALCDNLCQTTFSNHSYLSHAFYHLGRSSIRRASTHFLLTMAPCGDGTQS